MASSVGKQHGPHSPTIHDRRVADRRNDALQFRQTARIFTLRRTFGADTAYGLICRMGLSDVQAKQLLLIGAERRLHRRRRNIGQS